MTKNKLNIFKKLQPSVYGFQLTYVHSKLYFGQVWLKRVFIPILITFFIMGCAQLSYLIPQAGPSTQPIKGADSEYLTVVEVTPSLIPNFIVYKSDFSSLFKDFESERYSPRIDKGDVLEVIIYETPPAVLFSSSTVTSIAPFQTQGHSTFVLPQQIVDDEGYITVPFVGRVFVKGKTPEQVAKEIEKKLEGKANKPQVIVSLSSFHSSTVTVLGHVKESRTIPLTYNISTLLDVLGVVGGPTSPVHKTLIKVSRGSKEITFPLEELIKLPELNINLKPGDIITVIYQDQSATILGATGKNMELDFEATGITLSQALARAGGLRDEIAHAKGVFVFRYEDKELLDKFKISYKAYTKDGKVPMVYNFDLSRAETVLLFRDFPIKNKDIIYVSTAPAVDLKKFLSTVSEVIQPIFMIKVLSK